MRTSSQGEYHEEKWPGGIALGQVARGSTIRTSGHGGSTVKTGGHGGSTIRTSGQGEYHKNKWPGRE